ncbi:MAG: glycosyltransferase [Balneolaceae bacterium]
MANIADLSIIICTFNRAVYLKDTLSYLLKNQHSGQVEILIVDNNSTDSTRQIADKYAGKHEGGFFVRYVRETNQGLSFARNRGIRETEAPVLLFLDDDIRVEEDFLETWLTFFKRHPEVWAAGGKIEVQFDDPRPKWLSSYLLPLLGYHNHGEEIKLYPRKSYPFGGNMAFRRDIFELYGGFKTNLGRIGKKLIASEEKEFFNRLNEASIRPVYVPDAGIWHRVNHKRLTKEYIRRQATGLGQSLAIRVKNKSLSGQFSELSVEAGKWGASLFLLIFYAVTFRLSKGWMLILFRKWIIEGFIQYKSQK